MENSRAGRLREALRRSHVAIAMIALLYLWATAGFLTAIAEAWQRVGLDVAIIIAVRGTPTMDPGQWARLHMDSLRLAGHLFPAIAQVVLAWIVSRVVYGIGPLRALSVWSKPLLRRSHA